MRDNVMAKLIAEAKNQIGVSQGRKIHWVFDEEQAADVVRRRFEDSQDLARIDIFAMPWREGMK